MSDELVQRVRDELASLCLASYEDAARAIIPLIVAHERERRRYFWKRRPQGLNSLDTNTRKLQKRVDGAPQPSATLGVSDMSLRDEVARAILDVAHKAAIEYLRRERAGASASMNGAIEYVDFAAADVVVPLVIERCAKVADRYMGGDVIATAIRNLGSEA